MKERPILFSAPMVRAILAGEKTQTRRIIKPQPDSRGLRLTHIWEDWHGRSIKCPYGDIGDHLWVREAFVWTWNEKANKWDAFYKADGDYVYDDRGPARWKPSIHMPRFISRITLEVTGVRVERLGDISNMDAISEGVLTLDKRDYFPELYDEQGVWKREFGKPIPGPSLRQLFERLISSIHGVDIWDINPWVWVIEFKKIKP